MKNENCQLSTVRLEIAGFPLQLTVDSFLISVWKKNAYNFYIIYINIYI